jgi:hypothetical protein
MRLIAGLLPIVAVSVSMLNFRAQYTLKAFF